MKYYAVAVGRCSGIYTDWATAEKQVKGFAAAKFKGFPTKAEAEAWLENPVYQKKADSKSNQRGEWQRHNHNNHVIRTLLLSIPMEGVLTIPVPVAMVLS